MTNQRSDLNMKIDVREDDNSFIAEVDVKGAKAEYKDGVLSLVLPKNASGSAKRSAVS